MKKYFDVLGITEGASQEVIQEAYDRLSEELDPVNNNNQEFFVEEYDKLQEAYKALSNSTILKSSEKSYVYTNVEEAPQEALPKPNKDSITITFSPNKVNEFKNKSLNDKETNTHKEASQGWIIAGFVFAILGGWGGIAVGANYAFGNYKKGTKIIGWVMLIIGAISRGIWQSSH
jgi:curved DNA-binding protein CbpA